MMDKKKNYDARGDYQKQLEENEKVFKHMLKNVRPDLYVLMDLLDSTNVSPLIVFKIIRQLYNLAIGSKYGRVEAVVENGKVIFVKGEDSDRVNEDIITKKDSNKVPATIP